MTRVAITLALFLLPAGLPAATPDTCPVPGYAIQWIADYCMYKEQTDDLIAAGACIEREQAQADLDDCNTRTSYKAALCELHLARGSREGSLSACVADAGFSGSTVRNDGAR